MVLRKNNNDDLNMNDMNKSKSTDNDPTDLNNSMNTDDIDNNKQNTEINIESYERVLKRMTLIFLSLEKDFLYLSKHNKYDHYPLHFKYLHNDHLPISAQKSASLSPFLVETRSVGSIKTDSLKNHQTSFDITANEDYLLRNVLLKVFDGFVTRGECTVNLLESRKIALKLGSKVSAPPPVHYHNVPVLTCDLSRIIDNRWDIALQYVLKQINSVNHIKRICDILKFKLIDVDYDAIIECIKQLLYYKYIVITDIFKFNNLYIITKNIQNFINNEQMQQSALAFILKPEYIQQKNDELKQSDDDINDEIDADDEDEGEMELNDLQLPSMKQLNEKDVSYSFFSSTTSLDAMLQNEIINEIYKMYTKFDGKLTVKDFMKKYEWKSHSILKQLDIHKFVLFGSVNKLIRRIHRYPIVVDQEEDEEEKEEKNEYGEHQMEVKRSFLRRERKKKLISLCDGSHCFDEICCEIGLNQKEIKQLLSNVEYVMLLK